jgi:hypothetical protein
MSIPIGNNNNKADVYGIPSDDSHFYYGSILALNDKND